MIIPYSKIPQLTEGPCTLLLYGLGPFPVVRIDNIIFDVLGRNSEPVSGVAGYDSPLGRFILRTYSGYEFEGTIGITDADLIMVNPYAHKGMVITIDHIEFERVKK